MLMLGVTSRHSTLETRPGNTYRNIIQTQNFEEACPQCRKLNSKAPQCHFPQRSEGSKGMHAMALVPSMKSNWHMKLHTGFVNITLDTRTSAATCATDSVYCFQDHLGSRDIYELFVDSYAAWALTPESRSTLTIVIYWAKHHDICFVFTCNLCR